MFCSKCGRPVDLGQDLCADCAAQAQETPVAAAAGETTVLSDYAAPAGETTVLSDYAAPAGETTVLSDYVLPEAPSYTEPPIQVAQMPVDYATEEPKKSKKGVLIGIAAAVVALVALAVVLCMGPLKGMFVKNFGSPADYLLYVEEQAASENIDDVADVYAQLVDAFCDFENFSSDSEMHLLVGDALINILEQTLASQNVAMELDFLRDIAIGMDTTYGDTQSSLKASLELGDKTVANAEIYVDFAGETMILGIPALNADYLQIPMEGLSNANIFEMVAFDKLPSEENLAKLLNTYTGILRKHFTSVERSTETVSVNGVEQKLTVLTVILTAEDLRNMAIEVLETAKTDKDLEAFLDAVSAFYNTSMASFAENNANVPGLELNEPIDLHEALLAEIPYAIEAMGDAEDLDDSNYLQLTSYVDDSHKICGRTFEVYTENVAEGRLHYLAATGKDGSALEVKLTVGGEETLAVQGTYTDVEEIFNGSFDLYKEGIRYLNIRLTDCSEEKLQVQLTPTERFLEDVLAMEGSVTSVLGLASPSIEMVVSGNDTTGKMELYLKTGDSVMAGITSDFTAKEYAPVVLPQGPYVDGSDSSALSTWAENLDWDQLMNNLVAAGVPEELLEELLYSILFS